MALNFPSKITSGDDIEFLSSLDDYSSTDYVLSFVIVGAEAIASTTVADGLGWKTTIAADDSAVPAGIYSWSAVLVGALGNRQTVGNGRVKVLANLADLDTLDPRSPNEIMLDSIRIALAQCVANKGVTTFSFEGRSQTVDANWLMTMESKYQILVNQEYKKRAITAGNGDPSFKVVRFR